MSDIAKWPARAWIGDGLCTPVSSLDRERLKEPCIYRIYPDDCDLAADLERKNRALRRLLDGACNQGAHSGMSWGQAEEIILEALAGAPA